MKIRHLRLIRPSNIVKQVDFIRPAHERSSRIALTMLLAGLIFCVQIATFLFVAVMVLISDKLGLWESWKASPHMLPLVLMIAALNLSVSTVVTVILGKVPLKPVNRIINAINRLASGDFKARMNFSGIFAKHPTVKELSDSFNTMAEELENTELLRSDFINNFSHEFKTPIVSIAGFAKLLKSGTLTPEEEQEYLNIIEEESLRLSSMATNVLNLTKVENQSILTNVTRFNISEQIRTCALMLETKWSKKNIELILDFDEIEVSGNEELLAQVWVNLLDNAIKFSPESGIVKIELEKGNGFIAVSISNTGIAIPEQIQNRIFQKFYQADESHAAEGNGVGLSIVQHVLNLHSGKICVKCEDGITTFLVSLPDHTE